MNNKVVICVFSDFERYLYIKGVALQLIRSTGSLMWFPRQFTILTNNGSNLHSASVSA